MGFPWGQRGDPPAADNPAEARSRFMVALGSFGFATLFLGLGVMSLVDSSIAVSGAERTTGTVVGLRGYGLGDVAPVVRYQVDGKAYAFEARLSTRPRSYTRGDTVTVCYHRSRPGGGRLDSFGELWLFPMIFLACGTVFALFGVLVWKYRDETKGIPEPAVGEG